MLRFIAGLLLLLGPLAGATAGEPADAWIGRYWIGPAGGDFACSFVADCWIAAKTKPASPAAAPFASCAAERQELPFEPDWTRRMRKKGNTQACCYRNRQCKLPLRNRE